MITSKCIPLNLNSQDFRPNNDYLQCALSKFKYCFLRLASDIHVNTKCDKKFGIGIRNQRDIHSFLDNVFCIEKSLKTTVSKIFSIE